MYSTQVNVINGVNSSLSVGSRSAPVTDQQATLSKLSLVAIPIKVINPTKKCELKTYMLNIPVDNMENLTILRKHILEQLGKNVVSFDLHFDVGYFSYTHNICFVEDDDIKAVHKCLLEKGKMLCCDAASQQNQMLSVLTPTLSINLPLRIKEDGKCIRV